MRHRSGCPFVWAFPAVVQVAPFEGHFSELACVETEDFKVRIDYCLSPPPGIGVLGVCWLTHAPVFAHACSTSPRRCCFTRSLVLIRRSGRQRLLYQSIRLHTSRLLHCGAVTCASTTTGTFKDRPRLPPRRNCMMCKLLLYNIGACMIFSRHMIISIKEQICAQNLGATARTRKKFKVWSCVYVPSLVESMVNACFFPLKGVDYSASVARDSTAAAR